MRKGKWGLDIIAAAEARDGGGGDGGDGSGNKG